MMVLQMTKSAAQFEFEFVFGHVDIHLKKDLQGFWQDNISVYQPTRYEWEVANQLVAIRATPSRQQCSAMLLFRGYMYLG